MVSFLDVGSGFEAEAEDIVNVFTDLAAGEFCQKPISPIGY